MKKRKLIIPILITFSLGITSKRSYGQLTPLPYYENFDSAANARWTAYELGTSNPDDFPWNITVHHPYSPSFSMMHTCNTGTTQANDWTVSKKPFSFVTGGRIDSIRTWITGLHPPAPGDTIGIYLLTGNPDPGLASAKTLLHDFRGTNFQTDAWVKTINIVIPPNSGTSYIAFRYKTADNCINVFLDNMQLSGNGSTDVTPVFKAGEDFATFPNPVVNNLTIQSKEEFEIINIYDVGGKKVHTQSFQRKIDISFLPERTYILELIDKNRKKVIRKIVKQ